MTGGTDVGFCSPSASLGRLPRARIPALTELAERAGRVRCPFWRRRAGDALDLLADVLGWAAARHASLPSLQRIPPTPAGPPLPMSMRISRLRADFETRQYYVTGRLSHSLYAADCVFDGPDPDTPVRGTRKWTAATAGLFDHARSRVDLLGIRQTGPDEVRADWRLEGVLNLPWKPKIKPYTGTTVYKFDERGLVYDHFEIWSISAVDAFVSVVWPSFGEAPAPSAEILLAQTSIRDEKG